MRTDNEVTDNVDEVVEETPAPVPPTKGKQKRLAELRQEIEEIESEGPIEGVVDEDIQEVEQSVESKADQIVDSGAADQTEVDDQSEAAAEEVADSLETKGIVLSDAQVDAIADRIASRAAEKLSGVGEQKEKPSRRERDRAPKPTHWSERPISLRGRGRS